MSEERFQKLRILEALLFTSAGPQSPAELAKYLPEDEGDVEGLLQELRELYQNRGVVLQQSGERWAFRSAPDLAPFLRLEREAQRKLSRAAVETLAIVAYHQPVTRGEIEEIRGVALSKGTLDTLLEAGWIRPRGRRRTPGKPLTWGTTEGFLDQFGLGSLDALPGLDELKAAGLLDSRPAITALGERGLLPKAGGAAGEEGESEEEEVAEDLLGADFGEDLLPEDAGEDVGETPQVAEDRHGSRDGGY